ncbi:MLO-like protein 14 isoform X1 [Arachis hypogaea]|uniref:MLO-like protein 14 isoform X1 n=1 Tax=Arachis hypogaea TaxID=3818 RepID=UPI003B2138DD
MIFTAIWLDLWKRRIPKDSWSVAYSGDLLLLSCFPTLKDQISFWIAIIPVTLVLLVGTKLQHVIATLALENAGITGYFSGSKLRPRNELFWFNKPELLLSLIHFILFQNAFKLASFFWFWWQFGYNSCFIRNHLLVYLRLILGFAGQFLCSYSTLPLYALLTQMGTNYKAALIPERIRETIHGWGKAARRKRRHGMFADDSTIHTDTSTVLSLKEDDRMVDIPETGTDHVTGTEVELQPVAAATASSEAI